MIVVGIILILLAVFLPGLPHIVMTLGIVALIIGIALAALGGVGHSVGGRRWWF